MNIQSSSCEYENSFPLQNISMLLFLYSYIVFFFVLFFLFFQKKYPSLVSRARGLGTFCSFDLPDGATRDKVIYQLRQRGVHTGACGDRTLRFRPALIFEKQHVDIFMDQLHAVLSEMKK